MTETPEPLREHILEIYRWANQPERLREAVLAHGDWLNGLRPEPPIHKPGVTL